MKFFTRHKVMDFADQSTSNLTTLILLCFKAFALMLFSIFRLFVPAKIENVSEENKENSQ